MNLYAFTGKMGSGKTTACDYLVSKGGFVKVNFKDALVAEMKERLPGVLIQMVDDRNSWCDEYGCEQNWTIDRLFAEKPPIMRALMQNYGTEVRRRDDPDYWTKQYIKRVEDAFAQGFNVVTDDCRFLNEAQAVKDLGGEIVKIVRSDITGRSTHQSEVEMDSIVPDKVLNTEPGQLEALYAQLDFLSAIFQYGI